MNVGLLELILMQKIMIFLGKIHNHIIETTKILKKRKLLDLELKAKHSITSKDIKFIAKKIFPTL